MTDSTFDHCAHIHLPEGEHQRLPRTCESSPGTWNLAWYKRDCIFTSMNERELAYLLVSVIRVQPT
jgi:hypothetical protein